jgi:hypothetical protein
MRLFNLLAHMNQSSLGLHEKGKKEGTQTYQQIRRAREGGGGFSKTVDQ